jgi:FlaG/FlaF family flagellin (archaellin)
MGLRERLDAFGTGPLVALVVAAAAAVLVLAVAATVVLAAVVGTFVLGLGETAERGVQADASIQQDDEGGPTVVWTANQDAEYLVVDWSAGNGSVEATDADGRVSTDGDEVRLEEVGASVTLSDGAPETETPVEVVVRGVRGGEESVLVIREATA